MKKTKVNWKCECIGDEEYGDYTRMIIIKFKNKRYQVDKCLGEEIKYLLSQGITTIESCCGHKRGNAYIAVRNEDCDVMERLGYKRCINPYYPEKRGIFIPKTK